MANDNSGRPSGADNQSSNQPIDSDTGQTGRFHGAEHLSARDHGVLEDAIRKSVSRMVGAGHPEIPQAEPPQADAGADAEAGVCGLGFDPRLHPEHDPVASQLPGTDKAISYRNALKEALIDIDPRAHRAMIEELQASGVPMQTLAIHLFSPVAARLGDQWCDDEIDFMLVAVASTRLSMIINHLSHLSIQRTQSQDDRPVRRVLLARTGKAAHTIGVAIVASCFREMGWVVDGGVDTELDDTIHKRLSNTPYHLLGISVGQVDQVEECTRTIRRIHATPSPRRLKIAVGGPAVLANPDAFNRIGADIVAQSALQVVSYADSIRA